MLQKLIKAIAFAFCAMIALRFAALTLSPGAGSGKATKILMLGWIDFLARNLPNVTVNWSAIFMVLMCSTMLVIGTQWLCKSLYPITETSRGWRWRWTFAIFASLWLTFGIVIGASGAAKHTRWLIASNEPLYKERINYFVDMRGAALEMKYLLEEPRENLNGVHGHAITSMARRRSPLGLLDRYQYILLTDASNHIDSALLIPRDPEAQRRFGFVATSQPDKVIPMDQLSKYFQP